MGCEGWRGAERKKTAALLPHRTTRAAVCLVSGIRADARVSPRWGH
ncbi:MAG: hypothetical protein ACKERG_00465 [Candidatus Hodgkinia cicadicola]